MKRKSFYKNSTQQKQHRFVIGENGGAFQFSSFTIDSFKSTQYSSSKFFILIFCTLACLPTIQPNTIPLEAAFQGKCPPDGNPCTQICFNIHNNMYECGCKNGFVLSTDGYNCILQVSNTTDSQHHENVNKSKQSQEKKGSTRNQASMSSPVSENRRYQNDQNEDINVASFQNPLHKTTPSKSPLSIHIEVDIDPPPDDGKEGKKLTENEMQKLGLPSHHVHWSLPPVLSLSRKDEDTVKEHQNMVVEDNTLNDKINEVARVRNKAAYVHKSNTENEIKDKKDTKKANKENLLAPSDIRITYSVSDDLGGSGEYENDLSLNVNNFDDDGSHDSDTDSWVFGRDNSNQNGKRQEQPWYTPSSGDNKEDTEEIEPPRALPSRIVNEIQLGHHRNGDLSDRFPHSKTIDDVMKENVLNKDSVELLSNSNEYHDHIIQHDSNKDDSTSICDLDCGITGGTCFMEKEHHYKNDRNFNENDWVKIKKRCLCPLGKQGAKCTKDQSITSPYFSGHTSHLSLPTLTNAYSDLQLSLEFRPESLDGIILLTGETQEMTGDYLAIVLREGHVELRLDCGTGPGAVRTSGKVRLNHWNRLTVFRHDWGVWLQLNGGRHDEGRSQGLFSRITFALPVVLGSPEGHFSNTAHFLETSGSFQGCIRNLEINNKLYNFALQNNGGDAIEGVDIGECQDNSVEESCKSVKCHHHGTCAMKNASSKEDALAEIDARMEEDVRTEPYCQCPLGFYGKFCAEAVDVQVPSFSGTSYLIYAGFPNIDASPLWNEFEFVIRPKSSNGLIFYNGNDMEVDSSKVTDVNSEDFLAVFMSKGYLEFAFNAGDGITLIRSHHPLKLNEWHTVKVSRTGLLAEIQVDKQKRVSHIGAGAFTQVSTSNYNVYIGGVPNFEIVSPFLPVKNSFEGCIQKVSINNVNLRIMQSALGGINVGPCTDHPCSSGYVFSSSQDDTTDLEFPEVSLNNYGIPPCGDHGFCKPHLDNFTCECPLYSSGDRCQFQLPLLDNDRKHAIPGFTGDSFLHFENDDIAKNLIGNSNSINMRVKIAPNSRGLLLWTGGDTMSPASDYLMIGVAEHGKLHFRFNLGNGEAVLVYNETSIDDGRWHRIKATRTEQTATLKVDGGHIITGASPGKLRQLNGNGHLFIGGTEDLEYLPIQMFRKGIVGCVGELSIGRVYSIDMIQKAKNGRNVDACRDYNVASAGMN